ncbi:MAG: rod shape-determining protein MreC [Paludibacteraceae bacterium]|nr:rod shape-determining protein MreC [Paludibacteraceae bacterium]
METLIKFLKQSGRFLLFFVIELCALMVVFNSNAYQRSVFGRVSTAIAARTYAITTATTEYFGLKQFNQQLAEENAELKAQLEVLQHELCATRQLQDSAITYSFVDSLPHEGINEYITAKVVFNSINKRHNFIIINKGAKHGVQPDMGVVNAEGVVGVVQSVTQNHAVIISALNNLKISGKFLRNNFLTTVFWKGLSPIYGNLENIPRHMAPQVGDTITTSGFSAIFPEDVPIGIVKKVTQNTTTAEYDAQIEWSTNFGTLNYVHVVNNTNREEILQLQQKAEEENTEKK